MKLLLSTIAAALLAGALFAAPAQARCRFDGYAWHCSHPVPVIHHRETRFPSPSWGY